MTQTEDGNPEESPVYERARFSDRFVAYTLDLALFVVGFYATAFLLAYGLRMTRFPPSLALFLGLSWLGLFLLYHSYFSSDERQTLGKRLMGLRVYTADGYPPSFGKAFLRTVGYLPSSLPLNLGFLWAMLREDRAAWHDLIAGTQVLEIRPKGSLVRAASMFSALGLLALSALSWAWLFVGAPRYAQMQLVANAEMGIKALAMLEERHHQQTGSYTTNLNTLARLYGEPQELLGGLPQVLDMATLRIQADKDLFLIEARALDDKKTVLRLQNPPPSP